MGEKRRHHTVPKTYLKAFSTDRKNSKYLWVLDKSNGKVYEQNLNDVTVENKFYTLERIQDRTVWEDFYAIHVEPELSKTLRILLNKCEISLIQDQAIVLDDQSKANLSFQMALQVYRGKIAREKMKNFAKAIIPDLLSKAREKYGKTEDIEIKSWIESFYPDEEFIKTAIAEASINKESISKIAWYLLNCYWIVIRIKGNAEFVTSDNPVMVIDTRTNDATPFKIGLANPEAAVYYPISPTLMIAVYSTHLRGGVLQYINNRLIFIDSEQEYHFIENTNERHCEQCYRHVIAKSKGPLKKAKKCIRQGLARKA